MKELFDRSKEVMPPEERTRYLDDKAKWIVDYAYRNAPGVKKRLDKAGVKPSQINCLKDLERIPVLTKSELLDLQRANPPFGGFLAVPLETLRRVFISPGPLYDALGTSWDLQIVAKTFFAAGFRKGDIVINTFSYHLVPAGLLLDEGLKELGVMVIPAGTGNSELQVQIMRELGITAYAGTPSFLKTLIDRAEGKGYDFRQEFKLKRALLAAEMLPPSLRETFENDYGIDVFQAYGTADLGLAGYECGEKSGMHIPEEMIMEIVDPATGKQLGPGEMGEVVITTLNEIYPLIRFGTGDLSYYTDEPCPCGRTSDRLVRITGRVGDAVKVRGMFIHPRQVEEALSKFSQVSNFQVIVTRAKHRDEMRLKLELDEEVVDKEKLLEPVQDAIREVCKLKMDKIDFVLSGTIPKERKVILDERTWE